MTNRAFDLSELLTLRNADMLDDQIVHIDPIESQSSEDVPIEHVPIEDDGPVHGGGPVAPEEPNGSGPIWQAEESLAPMGPGEGQYIIVDETTVPAESDPFYVDEHTVPASDPIFVGESTGGPAPRPIGDDPVVDWGTDLNPTPPADEGDDVRIEGGPTPLETVDGPEMVNQPIEIDETFAPEPEPEMVNQPIEIEETVEADAFSDGM